MAMYGTLSVLFVIGFFIKGSQSQLNVCGQAGLNTKIVGGQNATAGSWPWQVSLQEGGFHFCGGSLINSRWILSAAHCFPGVNASALTVYLGKQDLQTTSVNEVSRSVTQIIVHESYSSDDNDIALLQLSSDVVITSYITPVCLAAPGSALFSGTQTWVTGWGNINSDVNLPAPGTLQEVQVPIVGNRKCNCLYGVGTITDNMLCAGLLTGGKDSCQGDSGGPLVIKQGSLWVQTGIVSFGIGCALANYPGVYARVSEYQTWINQKITSNQPGYVTLTSSGTDVDLSVSCTGLPPITTTSTAFSTATSLPANTTTSTAFSTATSLPPITTTSTAFSTATSLPANTTTTSTTATTSTTTTTASPVVCGNAKLNSRMGTSSSLSSAGIWPWMASLQLNGTHVCGGTLVAEQFVMTSASCFANSTTASDWTVVLGRLKNNGSNPNEVSVKVFNISFSNGTENNIAVLRLWSKPTLSDYIQPICVDLGITSFTINTPCWAAGWGSGGGAEQPLQDFNTTIVSCGNPSSSNSICTGLIPLEQTDKGGPLMCKIGQSWIQAAVLTLPSSSSNSSTKALILRADIQTFTKTSAHASFLRTEVGSFPPQATTVDSTTSTFTTTTITSVNSTTSTFTTTTITSVNSTTSTFTSTTTKKPVSSSGTQSFAFFCVASVFLMSLNYLI